MRQGDASARNNGESESDLQVPVSEPVAGWIHVERTPQAAVTSLGLLPFPLTICTAAVCLIPGVRSAC